MSSDEMEPGYAHDPGPCFRLVFGTSSSGHECWLGTRPAKSQLNLGHLRSAQWAGPTLIRGGDPVEKWVSMARPAAIWMRTDIWHEMGGDGISGAPVLVPEGRHHDAC